MMDKKVLLSEKIIIIDFNDKAYEEVLRILFSYGHTWPDGQQIIPPVSNYYIRIKGDGILVQDNQHAFKMTSSGNSVLMSADFIDLFHQPPKKVQDDSSDQLDWDAYQQYRRGL